MVDVFQRNRLLSNRPSVVLETFKNVVSLLKLVRISPLSHQTVSPCFCYATPKNT